MDMHATLTPSAAAPIRARSCGFTLIELLIVVVVVAILAAIALPSFISQVRKGRRADAITELFRATQAQERLRASSTVYSANVGTTGPAPLGLAPGGQNTAYNMPSGYYSVTASNAGVSTYTLVATAIGSMASDTSCLTMTLTMAQGTITYSSTNSGGPNAAAANNRCWNR